MDYPSVYYILLHYFTMHAHTHTHTHTHRHTHTHTHTEQRDFTPIHRQLTLSGGGHCENIAIVNDSILETDESFTVTITSSDPGVVIAKGNVVLTIQDDDCKC